MRTMRTPDGWQVAPVRVQIGTTVEVRLEIRSPAGTRMGSLATAEEALNALRAHGVDPAELIDAVGGE